LRLRQILSMLNDHHFRADRRLPEECGELPVAAPEDVERALEQGPLL
jgi:hypothetical protein